MAQEAYQLNTGKRGQRNTFQQGIVPESHYGVNPFDTGVTSQKGVLREQGMSADRGIPMNMPSAPLPAPERARCTATTKEGHPCRAWPVTGEPLCVGHKRGQGLNTS